MHDDLINALAVTAELCGTTLSEPAARVMLEDLSVYPLQQVLPALKRCRREIKGRLSLSDIVSRLDDGRPGAEEAWGMVPRGESETVVWTDEIAAAWGAAQPMLDEGETIPARMAFKEAYEKQVQSSRDEHRPVRWSVTLGHDAAGREGPIIAAMEKGRISQDRAVALLPGSVALAQRINGPALLEGDDGKARMVAGEIAKMLEKKTA